MCNICVIYIYIYICIVFLSKYVVSCFSFIPVSGLVTRFSPTPFPPFSLHALRVVTRLLRAWSSGPAFCLFLVPASPSPLSAVDAYSQSGSISPLEQNPPICDQSGARYELCAGRLRRAALQRSTAAFDWPRGWCTRMFGVYSIGCVVVDILHFFRPSPGFLGTRDSYFHFFQRGNMAAAPVTTLIPVHLRPVDRSGRRWE